VKRSRARTVQSANDSLDGESDGAAASKAVARAINESAVYRSLLQQLREKLQQIMMLEDQPIAPLIFDQETEATIARTQGQESLLLLKAELEQLTFMLQQLQDNTMKSLERDEEEVLNGTPFNKQRASRRGGKGSTAAPTGPTAEEQEIVDLRAAKQQQEQLAARAATVIQDQLEAFRRAEAVLTGSASSSAGGRFQSANDFAADVSAFETQVRDLVTRLTEAERLRSEKEVALKVATEAAALELNQVRADLVAKTAEAERLARELSARNQNVTNRDASIVLTREEVAQVRKTIVTAENERDTAKASLEALQLRFDSLEKSHRDLQAEHQAMKSRALTTEASLQAVQAELQTVQSDLANVTQARQQLQTQKDDLAAQKTSVDAQLAALTTEHKEAVQKKTNLERDLHTAASSGSGLAATLQTQLTASEDQVAQLRRDLQAEQATAASLGAKIAANEVTRAQLGDSLRAATESAASLQTLHKQATTELQAITTAKINELAAMQATVDHLNTSLAAQETLAVEAAQKAATTLEKYTKSQEALEMTRKLKRTLKDDSDARKVEVLKLQGQLTQAAAANADLTAQLNAANQALAEETRKLTAATAEVATERQKREAAEQETATERQKRETAEQETTGERSKREQAEKEKRNLAKLSKQVALDRTAELKSEREQREAAERERDQVRELATKAIQEHAAQIAQLNQQIQALELDLARETATKTDTLTRNKELWKEISELREEATAVTKQLAEAQEEKRKLEQTVSSGSANSDVAMQHDLKVFEKYIHPGYRFEPLLKDEDAFVSAQRTTLQRIFTQVFMERRKLEQENDAQQAEFLQKWTEYTQAVQINISGVELCLEFLDMTAELVFKTPDLSVESNREKITHKAPIANPIPGQVAAVQAWRSKLQRSKPWGTTIDVDRIPKSLLAILEDAQSLHKTVLDYVDIWPLTGSLASPPPSHASFVGVQKSLKSLVELRAKLQQLKDEHKQTEARLRGVETEYTDELKEHVRNIHKPVAVDKEVDAQTYVNHLRAINTLCTANNVDIDAGMRARLGSDLWTPKIKQDIHTLTTLLRLNNREWKAPSFRNREATLWEYLASVNADDAYNYLNDTAKPRWSVNWATFKAGVDKLDVGAEAILLVLPPELYAMFMGKGRDQLMAYVRATTHDG
jgi:hypothetical protein